jgi:hypothetical protein
LRKCDNTIVSALGRLVHEGFVTRHRRSKLIRTPQGERRVQESNAYGVHLPGENVGAARIPGLLSPLESDLKNSGVPAQKADSKQERSNPGDAEGRFWLSDPSNAGRKSGRR